MSYVVKSVRAKFRNAKSSQIKKLTVYHHTIQVWDPFPYYAPIYDACHSARKFMIKEVYFHWECFAVSRGTIFGVYTGRKVSFTVENKIDLTSVMKAQEVFIFKRRETKIMAEFTIKN
jgi:hypothetical protein